jgi:transposase-like protein
VIASPIPRVPPVTSADFPSIALIIRTFQTFRCDDCFKTRQVEPLAKAVNLITGSGNEVIAKSLGESIDERNG